MDFSVVLIVIVLIAICMIPFWLIIQAERNRKKKFLQQLQDAGRTHQLQVADYEFFNNKALGIDVTNKGVIFLKQKEMAQMVDLKKVQAVKLGEKANKVELQFVPIQNIVFFDADTDDPTQLSIHREKAKEWIKKIESIL
ncbi:MAG: hypothetical protein ACK4TA_06235 [Saprospiraceae bacterium]